MYKSKLEEKKNGCFGDFGLYKRWRGRRREIKNLPIEELAAT
jgi:hypothetical protein